MCVRVSGANNQHVYVTSKRNSSTLGSVAAAPTAGCPQMTFRQHNLHDDCHELECTFESPSITHT
jgi:hypothetical protein